MRLPFRMLKTLSEYSHEFLKESEIDSAHWHFRISFSALSGYVIIAGSITTQKYSRLANSRSNFAFSFLYYSSFACLSIGNRSEFCHFKCFLGCDAKRLGQFHWLSSTIITNSAIEGHEKYKFAMKEKSLTFSLLNLTREIRARAK